MLCKPSPSKDWSRLPSAFSRATAKSLPVSVGAVPGGYVYPTTTTFPSSCSATAVATSIDEPKSTTLHPSALKEVSSVPSRLYRATAKSKLGSDAKKWILDDWPTTTILPSTWTADAVFGECKIVLSGY